MQETVVSFVVASAPFHRLLCLCMGGSSSDPGGGAAELLPVFDAQALLYLHWNDLSDETTKKLARAAAAREIDLDDLGNSSESSDDEQDDD